MNKDYKTQNEESNARMTAAAEFEERARQAMHKKETEADLKRINDDLAKVSTKKQTPTSVAHEAHIDLEARVTRLEEAVRLASPEAAAHLDKK